MRRSRKKVFSCIIGRLVVCLRALDNETIPSPGHFGNVWSPIQAAVDSQEAIKSSVCLMQIDGICVVWCE